LVDPETAEASREITREVTLDRPRLGAAREGRLRIGKRKLRLNFAPLKPGEEWPAIGFVQRERPLSG